MSFWDHVFAAAGHLLDAQSAQRQAEEPPPRKRKRVRTDVEPAPRDFGRPLATPKKDCCVAKRE